MQPQEGRSFIPVRKNEKNILAIVLLYIHRDIDIYIHGVPNKMENDEKKLYCWVVQKVISFLFLLKMKHDIFTVYKQFIK